MGQVLTPGHQRKPLEMDTWVWLPSQWSQKSLPGVSPCNLGGGAPRLLLRGQLQGTHLKTEKMQVGVGLCVPFQGRSRFRVQ